MLKAVIFDLFNTLTSYDYARDDMPWTADVLGVPRSLWASALTESSGPRLTGTVREPIEIMRQLARSIGATVSDEILAAAALSHQQIFARLLNSIPLANLEILEKIRGIGLRIAVLSNCDCSEIRAWSGSPLHGLFDVEVFSCEFGIPKPQPEIYYECLRRLKVTPGECLFVGDGGHGELTGAKAVGLHAVLFSGVIRHSWPERIPALLADADFHITSLDQLFSMPMFCGFRSQAGA